MGLHRPYISVKTREIVEERALKNEDGKFLDANTGKVIEGSYDLGHKPGHEWRRLEQKAQEHGWTQEELNAYAQNPSWYQVEDPHENRSHKHELPDEKQYEQEEEVEYEL